MTKLDSVLKSRDITLPIKVHIVKAMVFPAVMYRCESWSIKKAGCWRIDAFKLWCWRRLLRVCWTARRAHQSILKEINLFIGRTDAKTPVLWPHHTKSRLIGKDHDASKDWRQEEKGEREEDIVRWYHWLNGHKFEKTRNGGQRSLTCYSPWGCKERTQLSDWTTKTETMFISSLQRNWTSRRLPIYLCLSIYYEELTHVIMEADKIHNLPSGSRRPRKASDVIQFESEGLRTRRAD